MCALYVCLLVHNVFNTCKPGSIQSDLKNSCTARNRIDYVTNGNTLALDKKKTPMIVVRDFCLRLSKLSSALSIKN